MNNFNTDTHKKNAADRIRILIEVLKKIKIINFFSRVKLLLKKITY